MSKSKNKITNWKPHSKALAHNGSITFLGDDSAIDSRGCNEYHGKRSRGLIYTTKTRR